MKSARILAVIAIGALVLGGATKAFGGGLSKQHKKWDRSPEAYFLTMEEKAQWKKVQTDEEAQNFILDYKARRGPDFQKMLDERIAAADKYFSAGETRGSETLRGKVIIVFGPPSGVDTGKAKETTTGLNPTMSMGNTGNNQDASLAASSAGAGSPLDYHPPHVQSPTFTLQYDAQAAPKAIGKPFSVELKMISNAEQESWDEKDLDAKFDAVAKASIAPPAEEKPKTDAPAEKQ